MEPRAISLTAAPVLMPFLGREAQVAHEQEGCHQGHAQHERPQQVGHAEVGHLRHDAAQHGAAQHRHAADGLAAAEDGLEVAAEAGGAERVDQPGLGGAAEEGEPQAQQDGGEGPADERRLELPHGQVEQRGQQQDGRAEHEGEAAPPRVRHDAGGNLEDHHPDGEEGVGGERLGVVEPGIEQEERVDAPDERGSQGRQQRQQQVDALDMRRGGARRGRGRGHGPVDDTCPV